MFEWNSSYSVGIASIDEQHKQLFGIAAELFKAMSAGQGQAALRRILDRLLHYTASHFAHEERLMSVHGYPELAAHKAQHDSLTRQVKAFCFEIEVGRKTITVQLMTFLKEWLVKHIQASDQAYAPYLIGKAVS